MLDGLLVDGWVEKMDGRGERNKKEEMRWDEMGCQVCLLLVGLLQYLPCLPPSCSQSVGG